MRTLGRRFGLAMIVLSLISFLTELKRVVRRVN
jgi:hypothetical protein